MALEQNYISTMNKGIRTLIQTAVKVSFKKPAFSRFITKNMLWQSTAEQLRTANEVEGYKIPPFLIASITSRCNLMCKGCYDQCQPGSSKEELSTSKWLEIMAEAKGLGISFVLVAGGEPFTRMDILEGLGQFPEIIFPIFTNGTYIDQVALKLLNKNRNLIPIISLEGYEQQTDERRGLGVYQKVSAAMVAFNKESIFFGVSITITNENYDLVTSNTFVESLIHQGCKIFFYVEYIPLDATTIALQIDEARRNALEQQMLQLRECFSALFISFPGDESKMGGCLSSGRGFAHINASGDLEPCPFSPYSDVNLNESSLKEALQSQFLKAIRESDVHLSEVETGCALFNKKDWVLSLLHKTE